MPKSPSEDGKEVLHNREHSRVAEAIQQCLRMFRGLQNSLKPVDWKHGCVGAPNSWVSWSFKTNHLNERGSGRLVPAKELWGYWGAGIGDQCHWFVQRRGLQHWQLLPDMIVLCINLRFKCYLNITIRKWERDGWVWQRGKRDGLRLTDFWGWRAL